MDETTSEAARHVLAFFGQPGGYQAGGFITALLEAIMKADQTNRAKLALGFPKYVEAVMLAVDYPGGIALLQDRVRR